MGFEKEQSGEGRARWRRVAKPPLSKEALDAVVCLTAESARVVPTGDKRVWLYSKFESLRHTATKDNFSAATTLVVTRINIFGDSFEQFRSTTGTQLQGELKVQFENEVAQDAGGPIREWFSGVVEALFSSAVGLFRRADVSELSFIINENSGTTNEKHLEHLHFAGQVIAKALFERIPIKAYLNWVLLKQILGQEVAETDLRRYDKQLSTSVAFLRQNRLVPDQPLATFTASRKDPVSACDVVVELKPAGKDIAVSEGNKEEFIQLFIDYHLRKKVQSQLASFLDGFYSVVPKEYIASLDPDELEFFICGENTLDMADWRENTTYRGYYGPDHEVIRWFWTVLEHLGEEYRQRFLQFATGSSRVPAEGFRGLTSNSGHACTFCIEPKEYTGPDTAFVVAHTCFNRIELPHYPSIESMENSVREMLDEPGCVSFALE